MPGCLQLVRLTNCAMAKKPVESATKVCKLTNWDDPVWLDTPVTACAQIKDGWFRCPVTDNCEAAVKWQEKTIDLLTDEVVIVGWLRRHRTL